MCVTVVQTTFSASAVYIYKYILQNFDNSNLNWKIFLSLDMNFCIDEL